MNKHQVVMIGGGGHAVVLAEELLRQSITIDFVVCPEKPLDTESFIHATHLTNDSDVFNFQPEECVLINGIGSVPPSRLRESIFVKFKEKGYVFRSVVCKTAIISPSVSMGEGVQVMHNSVVSSGTVIGANSILNTGTIVDHHCVVGDHCHLATGVTMSGQVEVGAGVHVGTGANIINNISIGNGAVISVGANIVSDCPAASTVFPARGITKSQD